MKLVLFPLLSMVFLASQAQAEEDTLSFCANVTTDRFFQEDNPLVFEKAPYGGHEPIFSGGTMECTVIGFRDENHVGVTKVGEIRYSVARATR